MFVTDGKGKSKAENTRALQGWRGHLVQWFPHFWSSQTSYKENTTQTHTHTHKGTNIGLPTFILQNETVKIITISYHNHSIKEMIF